MDPERQDVAVRVGEQEQFQCGCGMALSSIVLGRTFHIAIHRCSRIHREWRGIYREGEETTLQLFFDNAMSCHCGQNLSDKVERPCSADRMHHVQNPRHLRLLHAKMDMYGKVGKKNNSCILCCPGKQAKPPKSLVWTFDEIQLSYKEIVMCVVERLLQFQKKIFGLAKTSLVDLMIPDVENLIAFDPAYILDLGWRHRNSQIGVTDEQIFAGSTRFVFQFSKIFMNYYLRYLIMAFTILVSAFPIQTIVLGEV